MNQIKQGDLVTFKSIAVDDKNELIIGEFISRIPKE